MSHIRVKKCITISYERFGIITSFRSFLAPVLRRTGEATSDTVVQVPTPHHDPKQLLTGLLGHTERLRLSTCTPHPCHDDDHDGSISTLPYLV